MRTALLHNGDIITADEYDVVRHGSRIFCIDQTCKAPVIHVSKGSNNVAYFKTTGKGDAKHKPCCGFFEPMDLVDSVKKIDEYQQHLLDKGVKENIVKLNLNALDPDYKAKQVNREKDNEKKEKAIKVKNDGDPPNSISSVKSVVKLLTSYEPDLLASILVTVGGQKLPISKIILNQKAAHDSLWSDGLSQNLGYFVYGKISKVLRREKVCYINFEPLDEVDFTLVIFEKYFKHFTYKNEDLEGKDVLVYGQLRKNQFGEIEKTEMLIKSNKYLEVIKRKEKKN